MPLRARSTAAASARPVAGHVAAPRRRADSVGVAGSVFDRHRWPSASGRGRTNKRPSPSRRGSLRSSVVRRALAPVPPRASVLPPGAGNEPKKPIKARERAKKGEEGYVGERSARSGTWTRRPSRRHDDGDAAAILAIELAQAVSKARFRRRARAVAQSSRVRAPSTSSWGRRRGWQALNLRPRSCRRHAHPVASQSLTTSQAREIDRLAARRLDRSTQQVALAGADPERRTNSSCSGVSTPSAMTSAPHRSARSLRVRTTSCEVVRTAPPWTSDRSILTMSKRSCAAAAARHCRRRRRRRRCACRPPGTTRRPGSGGPCPRPPRAPSARGRPARVDAVAREQPDEAVDAESSASRVRGDRLRVRLPGRLRPANAAIEVCRQARSSSTVRPTASAAANSSLGIGEAGARLRPDQGLVAARLAGAQVEDRLEDGPQGADGRDLRDLGGDLGDAGARIAGGPCCSASNAVTTVRPWRFPKTMAASASRKKAARSRAVPGMARDARGERPRAAGDADVARRASARPSSAVASTRRRDRYAASLSAPGRRTANSSPPMRKDLVGAAQAGRRASRPPGRAPGRRRRGPRSR